MDGESTVPGPTTQVRLTCEDPASRAAAPGPRSPSDWEQPPTAVVSITNPVASRLGIDPLSPPRDTAMHGLQGIDARLGSIVPR